MTNQVNSLMLQQLFSDPEDMVQLLYVHLSGGKTFVFVGSPISEEEFETLENVTFGECMPKAVFDLMRSASAREPLQ